MNADIKSLVVLYCLDLVTPGSEMLLILTVSACSWRAAFGVVFGVSLGTLFYKVGAVFGVAAILNAAPNVAIYLRWSSALFFVIAAFLLIKKGVKGDVASVGEKKTGGQRAFMVGFASVFLNPFSLLATIPLLGLTVERGLTKQDAVVIGLGLVALNFLWSLFLAMAGRLSFARFFENCALRRTLFVVVGCMFLFYAMRFVSS